MKEHCFAVMKDFVPYMYLLELIYAFSGKRSTSSPAVTLPVYSKNNGSRNYDKLQCCFVCDKLVKTSMGSMQPEHNNNQ